MKKSEISLFLNFKACLEDIEKNYKEGLFIIFESDVRTLPNVNQINEFFDHVYSKKENWDMIHFGFGGDDQLYDSFIFQKFKSPYRKPINRRIFAKKNLHINFRNKFIEDISSAEDNIRLIRHFNTRCLDTLIFTYNGIKKLLNHFNNEQNYGSPMDYYIINFLETNSDYKHYWSNKSYFLQMSNYKEIPSTIQN